MIQHHVSEDLLLEYAAGALNEASSLLIATHLALCPPCRALVGEAEALGGALLEGEQPDTMSAESVHTVLERLAQHPVAPASASAVTTLSDRSAQGDLPQPLRGYVAATLSRQRWRPVAPGLQQLILGTASGPTTARLFRLAPGTRIPVHSHRGLELTLVLRGSYHDECGIFARGDVAQCDDSVTHRPVVDQGAECLTLAVTEAPLRFRSLAVRLIQPLLGV
jgi:putative transcriptional regulator